MVMIVGSVKMVGQALRENQEKMAFQVSKRAQKGCLPYFFSYRPEFFLPNNPKKSRSNIKDGSGYLGSLGRVRLILYQNFIGLI